MKIVQIASGREIWQHVPSFAESLFRKRYRRDILMHAVIMQVSESHPSFELKDTRKREGYIQYYAM